MNLRLKITTPDGSTRSFEHAGSVVRIGRDPESELAMQGDDGRAVSWNHARIELAAGGATIADAGSSNGTLLNDQRIEKPMPLRVGDRVQLGHTGATLMVTSLDLAAPAAQRPPVRLSLPPAKYVGAAVVVGVVLAGGWYLLSRGFSKPTEDVQAQACPPQVPNKTDNQGPSKPVEKNGPEDKSASDGQVTIDKKAPEPPQAKAEQASPAEPPSTEADEGRDVGRYVALPEWGPGNLLERRGAAYPWTPLRRESKVTSGSTLVSLPGYRSRLTLDTGVQLTLWGNIPEFSPFPPVLESAVMLDVPPAGFDADVTLERGRIHLVNTKPAGASQIQLRFLRQVWQLTLPKPGHEACVELWPLLGQPPASANDQVAPVVVGLLVKGTARLQASGRTLELADRSRVSWVNVVGGPPHQDQLKELPAWWTMPPDRKQPRIEDAMISLVEWSNDLDKSKDDDVVATILTPIRESKDPTLRCLGLLFLAALDEPSFLIGFLEERQDTEVRGTARHALQVWLSRRPDGQAELARFLKEKRYPQETASLIGRLLQPLPEADRSKPETYQQMIAWLNHDSLIVRDLAFWQLAQLAPEGAAKIEYDPVAEVDKRRKSISDWQKLIPPGKVPKAPASQRE